MTPLADLLRPVRGRIAAASALYALGAVAGVVPFVAIVELGRVLLIPPVDEGRAWGVALVGTGALAVRLGCLLAASGLTHLADTDLQLSVQRRLVAHLGRVPLGWFTERNAGAVKKAMVDDVAALHHLVAHSFTDLTAAVVGPTAVVTYLAWTDWRFTLVTVVPLVAGIGLYAVQMRGYPEKVAAYDQALAQVNAASVEFVQGIAVVKAFGPTGRAHARFGEAADQFAATFWSWVRGLLGLASAAEIVTSPLACLTWVLGVGAVFVGQGWLTPLDLLAFAVLGVGLPAPIVSLGYAANQIQVSRPAAARVRALLDTPTLSEPATNGSATTSVPDGTTVRYEGIGFSYDGSRAALADVDLVLEPGTVTALVGASGSGKSTLARLLARFADPTEGRITVGGVDIREVAPADLSALVGFVFQDSLMLRTSVAENLRLGRPGATDAEVEAAARAAGVHRRILELPRGYATVVGLDARLSGGEAQRLSVARALVADAPVLVLDEATAYADPDAESAIQDALSRLAAGRTLLVVAHRLATVVGADRIVVLDRGRVVESGRHDDLVAAGGRYTAMWDAHQRAATLAAPQPNR